MPPYDPTMVSVESTLAGRTMSVYDPETGTYTPIEWDEALFAEVEVARAAAGLPPIPPFPVIPVEAELTPAVPEEPLP